MAVPLSIIKQVIYKVLTTNFAFFFYGKASRSFIFEMIF